MSVENPANLRLPLQLFSQALKLASIFASVAYLSTFGSEWSDSVAFEDRLSSSAHAVDHQTLADKCIGRQGFEGGDDDAAHASFAWGFRSSAWEDQDEWTHACVLETDRSTLRVAATGGSTPSSCTTCMKLIVGLDDSPFECKKEETIALANGEAKTMCTNYYRQVHC
mmetsp:Transcript_14639/g.25793  ORF Transcript_14639/g.25793 Transcript_14639/m.25793 type:complete len:168 (-) Transcript_14639:4511-5014(-)